MIDLEKIKDAKTTLFLYEKQKGEIKEGSVVEKDTLLLREILSSRLFNRLYHCIFYRVESLADKEDYTLEDLLLLDDTKVKSLRNLGVVSLNEFKEWKKFALNLQYK